VRTAWALALSAALCAGGIAAGADAPNAPVTLSASEAVSSGEPQAQARLVNEFSEFAGSAANVRSLVAGLRQGTEITLTTPGGQPGTATRFTPPTRPMDYGNVRMALLLAREQLAQLDITEPTPAQINAVLAGGGIASRVNGPAATPYLHPGVLQMRAGGMSWARIAATMGVTLAQIMNGKARPAKAPALTDSRRPAASFISVAGARTDEPARRPASAAPAPISSASITTSSAGAPRILTVKPIVAERRPPKPEAEPETRPSGAGVLAAADRAARTEEDATLVQEGMRGGTAGAIPAIVAPSAANEPGASGVAPALE